MCKTLHLTVAAFYRAGRLLSFIIPMLLTVQSYAMLSVSFNVTQPVCYGLPNGSVTATAGGGVAPYVYVWNTGVVGPTLSGITAGTYSVTVTDATSTSIVQSVIVNQPPLVVIDFVVNQCTFPFTLTAVGGGGVPPYGYYWNTGQTTATLTNIPNGTYCVTVTDSHNCGAVECITLTYTPLNLTVSATGVTCPGVNNGTVSASGSGGTPPYSFLWSNGATTPTQTNLAPGTYSVTLTDSQGCTRTASATVVNKPPIIISVATTQPTCTGYSNGSLSASVTGGTPPYTYLWSTGQTTATISNLSAGTYTLVVTDANGCTKSTAVSLQPYSNLTVGALGTPESCPGFNNGFLTATGSNGVQPYTYLWSNGSTLQNQMNVSPGTYTVTITDAVGCSGTATATVAPAPPFSISVTGSNITTCGAANGVANANIITGTGPFTYAWSNGGNTASITGLVAGTYSVTVTNGVGCLATGSITLTAPPPVFVTINATPLVCVGAATGTATAIVSGGTAPFSFLWNTGATTQTISNLAPGIYSVTVTDAVGCQDDATTVIAAAPAVIVNIAGTNIVCGPGNTGSASALVNGGTPPFTYLWSTGATTVGVTGLVEGTYSVTVTDANGCSGQDNISIDIIDNLTVNIIKQNVLCFGGSTGSAAASGSGGTAPYSFVWSTGSTNAAINNLTAGSYSVTITDANGCTATNTTTVTQPPVLNVTLNATALVCTGASNGSASATATGGTQPYTYAWSNGGSSSTINNLGAGTFTVTVTDANGCQKTATATINQAPPVDIAIESEQVFCGPEDSGDATVVVNSGTPPFTYTWSNGSTAESIENIGDGAYSVTVIDANGCSDVAEIEIEVISDFSLSIIPRNLLCNGDNSGGILIIPNGGTPPYSFNWNTGFTGNELSDIAAGTYSVTVTETDGCTLTETITITQPPVLMATPTAVNVDCFGGNDGMATVIGVGGTPPYSYLWSNGQTTATATNLTSGAYSVTLTDSNFCTATANVNITQPPALNINVTTGTINCFGASTGSATAIASGGTGPYSYLWSNGATTSTVNGLPAGTYGVTVTDALGCSNSTQTVSVSQLPQLQISFNVTDIICVNTPIGAISATVTGGAGPYSFLWSTGATTNSISNLAAGTYGLTVTDINGCTTSGSETVIQSPSLMVTVVDIDITCFGLTNGSATANVVGGTPPFSFTWSNGGNAATINNLAPGTYSVTVNDSAGCSGTASGTITQPTQLTLTTTDTDIACFGGANGTASCIANGGTPPYSFVWSNGALNPSISGLPAGSYTVTATDANGCTQTATVTITQPPALQVTTTPLTSTCQGGTSGSASVSANGGTPPYSFNWSNGQTSSTATGLGGGAHSVTVTDSNGCSSTSTVNVSTFAQPTCTVTITQPITDYVNGNGQATCTASGGTPPYSFAWSNGQNTPLAINLNSGTYTVTVTDANGCTTTCSVTFGVPALIGDFVWLDIDRDGIQDPGEVGIPNVTVYVSGTAENTPYADTTVTNANGLYYFEVPPGTYKVTFTVPSATFTPSPRDAGSNDAVDSDGDLIMLMTDLFTISAGEIDLTFDQGFYPPCQNVTDPGIIGYDQVLCGPGNVPNPIISVEDPSGGYGELQYLWMMSTQPGPFNAQTWQPIPNSNTPFLILGPVYQTTYYTRCVRRDSCTTYIEPSPVAIIVDDVAVANITGNSFACTNLSTNFSVSGNTANPQVQWTLAPGIVAETPLNQANITVHFTSFGTFTLFVSVTENGCTATNFKTVTVSNCFSALSIDVNVMNQQMRSVSVHWAVPELTDMVHYIVERSSDGVVFSAIADVTDPVSTSGMMNHFEYIDVAPKLGRTYYRVRAVRSSGEPIYSDIKSAVIYGDSELALYYPNPVDDELTIELFETFNEEVHVELTNAQGAMLYRAKAPANAERVMINFAEYPSGAYFVRLKYGKTDVKTLKILKR